MSISIDHPSTFVYYSAMNVTSQHTRQLPEPWHAYRNNFSRHLIGLARYLQTNMMVTLQKQKGYRELRLSYTPYILLLDKRGRRLNELAALLDISKQACNQAINQIEAAGHVRRCVDPDDGRARRVALTTRGSRLRRDGIGVLDAMDSQFARIAGDSEIRAATATYRNLYGRLGLSLESRDADAVDYEGLCGLLPRLADYTMQRLMQLTMAQGHPDLKMSYGQVLTLIGPCGGRIQQMAAIHDVSKQAISAIVSELENLGYLRREADPLDARQALWFFSRRGERLIADSVASVGTLHDELEHLAGSQALTQADETLAALYGSLQLEDDVFESDANDAITDVHLLERQLRDRLGNEACRTLGQLLINNEQDLRQAV